MISTQCWQPSIHQTGSRSRARVDAFDFLGIPDTATESDISSAWKRLARLSHPDMHPSATPEQRIALTDRMAVINAAYDEFREPVRRENLRRIRQSQDGAHADTTTTGTQPRTTYRPPRFADGCEMCGLAPARKFTFQQITGQIFRDLVRTFEARLCRDCAQAIGREMQSKTLITGWWGVFAILRNVYAIGNNTYGLLLAGRMPPISSSGNYVASPLPVGAPLFKRLRTWVGLGVTATIVGIIISGGVDELNRPSMGVGACVSGYSSVEAVSCDGRHDGKIVSIANTRFLCPVSTEEYIPFGSKV